MALTTINFNAMNKHPLHFYCLFSVACLYAHGVGAATYSQQATVVDAGGTRSASVSYSQHSSIGGISGISEASSGGLIVEAGYLGQIVDFANLERPSAVVAQSAIDVDTSSFVARWMPAQNAESYRLDVSLDEEFSSFIPGYSNIDVGPATQFLVDNLTNSETYYYRITGENSDGLSESPSNVIEVLVSDNTPFVKWTSLTRAVVSVGSVDTINLLDLFNGTGVLYSVQLSDPSLLNYEINGTILKLSFDQQVGEVDVVIGVASPSGFEIEHIIKIEIIVAPSITAGGLIFNRQNGLYEQLVTVTNDSVISTALSVKLTVSGLTANESLYNATGVDLGGKPVVDWDVILEPQSSIDFILQYQTIDRSMLPEPSVVAQLSFEQPLILVSGESFDVEIKAKNLNGRLATLLEFPATLGKTYFIQYKNSMNEDWKTVFPAIVARANRIQWIDSGPPSTGIAPGELGAKMRFYRVIKVK